MRKHPIFRFLSLAIVACLLLSFAAPVQAAGTLTWAEVEHTRHTAPPADRQFTKPETTEQTHKDTDQVRVSILLADRSTVQAGYATAGIAQNAGAMAYRDRLLADQEAVAQAISTQVLGGQELDVVWNMTLACNLISANVPYGKLEEIRTLDGVQDVILEQQYMPLTEQSASAEPQTILSDGMTGAGIAWADGYTGAGSRIAVIDTGTDTDHQSFDNGAFLYALAQDAEAAGEDSDDYIQSLSLLDKAEIEDVLPKLHAYERTSGLTAEQLYLNEKLPFGYNYVDKDLDITHDRDSQGGHGSHVGGIATANRYLPDGKGSYIPAAEAVYVTGSAPDAQLITMKVFGKNGGAYDSDYMAAIEDAILLDCDTVNLSLGSPYPGYAYNDTYAQILDGLTSTDTVVTISAGNSGYWVENAATGGYLYSDGANFAAGGSPGTYANALTVASVDNAGAIGPYFQVNDRIIVYTETTGYRNQPMAGLDSTGTGTAFPFVYVDGVGRPEDYQGMDLTGKVVFCARGDTSFFEKANAAAGLGAAAVVIYNNQPGSINMDLSGYEYDAPCVSITQEEGMAVKEAGTAVTAGDKTYYQGTLQICSDTGVSHYDWSSMSSFSSWGVPGTLSLKPEITAPGGNILSVNGELKQTDQYVLMSGTSMATPHLAGLDALLAQYIREEQLAERTGLSPRTLAQSLLMSTAQPLRDENGLYYPVLQQGAGLAQVDKAIAAQSYVLVDGQSDGKVKAELGDDPEKAGVYQFSFTLNNLTEEARDYALSADLFTQDVFAQENTLYLDTATKNLPVNAAFSVDGVPVASRKSLEQYDWNDDGTTDAQDANYLLACLLDGKTLPDGDVNGDGKVNTYDAHLLLALLESDTCVTLPAGGQLKIDVTLTLSQEIKAYLDEATPNGAYLEAFVYAEAVTDEEGAQGDVHTIPVLGFYGSWTDPSMFDVGSYLDDIYGTETRTPYLGQTSNVFTISYAGDSGDYIFGGNPLADEETYLPQRNAFNNQSGDILSQIYFALIRVAGNCKLTVRNRDTGEAYIDEEVGGNYGAFYYTNGQSWQNTQLGLNLSWAGTDSQGKPLPDGTPVEISLSCAPEYYRNADGSYRWDDLGRGAAFTTQLTIDNTAPQITDISLSLTGNRALSIRAKDNQYVAAVTLMNASGTKVLETVVPNQTEAAAEIAATLRLDSYTGNKFLVAVYDYAMNETVYEVKLNQSVEIPRPYFTAVNRSTQYDGYLNWVGFDREAEEVTPLADVLTSTPRAAAYADGYVFAVTDDNHLLVAEDEDLSVFTEIAALSHSEYPIKDFRDLAYSRADGKLYGLYYSGANQSALPYLCAIDPLVGAMEVLGELGADLDALAIDEEGTFYGKTYGGGDLYTYTLETYRQPELVGNLGDFTSRALNTMTWDANTNRLYWGYCADSKTQLVEIDPVTAEAAVLQTLPFASVGLYTRPETQQGALQPTDQVAGVTLNENSIRLMAGEAKQLQAKVLPWTITNSQVTWTSSDASVASVDQSGRVTANAPGSAVITAAAVLDPGKTASCTVEVFTIQQNLNALIWDEEGSVWWSEFATDQLPSYTKLTEEPYSLPLTSVAYGPDGLLYAATLDTETVTSQYYQIDEKTWTATAIGDSEIGYMDLAYAPHLGEDGVMLAVYGQNIVLIDPDTGNYFGGWNWYGGANLVGIAYCESTYDEEAQVNRDCFFLIDADGDVYYDAFSYVNGEYQDILGAQGRLGNLGFSTDTPYFSSAYFDGQYLFWSKYTQSEDRSRLIVWDCTGSGLVHDLGTFDASVWPVGGLFQLGKIPTGRADTNYSALLEDAVGTPSLAPEELDTMELRATSGGLQSAALPQDDGRSRTAQASPIAIQEDGTVTVALTAPADTTNGRLRVTYDQEKLTFLRAESGLAATAQRLQDGVLEFAYADQEPVSSLLLLTFQAKPGAIGQTQLQILTTERNDNDALALTETLDISLFHACYAKLFQDVNLNAWYHESIDFVVSQGLMTGVAAGHFRPDGELTRAQLVTVLYRMAGEPETEERTPFQDISEGRFYTDAVAWAYETGIAKGVTDTKFAPNTSVTREQMATFFARYAAFSGNPVEPTGDLSTFADSARVSPFALESMRWAVAQGLIQGTSATTLSPKNHTTRAQAAAVLMRFCQVFA